MSGRQSGADAGNVFSTAASTSYNTICTSHHPQKAGVELDDAGAVKVDTFSRTNQRHIFAVGDVTNRLNLTPVALMEGMAVAVTLFGEKEKPADHKNVRMSHMPRTCLLQVMTALLRLSALLWRSPRVCI